MSISITYSVDPHINKTVHLKAPPCRHQIAPLGCADHEYQHLVGTVCSECGEQWFFDRAEACVNLPLLKDWP